MSELLILPPQSRRRVGLKGPRAAEWLTSHGIALPMVANSWTASGGEYDDALLVARLGGSEFFLEDGAAGGRLDRVEPAPPLPSGVYPVLREDAAFVLAGNGSLDVLAQVCHVNFAAPASSGRALFMTSMAGVSVLVVPQDFGLERRYRIWCDPTFGRYLEEILATVIVDGGGSYRRESA